MKKGVTIHVFVPLLQQIDCTQLQQLSEEEEISTVENDLKKIFILENLSHKGYKDDISDLDGLGNHTKIWQHP